jgi:eukaryotic-like serine/threonine-protein kinase
VTSTVPGRLVAGRYRLVSRIAGGGMGAVWLGRDELLGREVAVKQVLMPAGVDPEVAGQLRQRAMREGRIAARLSHPHAVSVFDVALEDDVPWLVMEYLPSRSLAVVLHEDGVLRPDQAAQVGAQLADALVAVHEAGIVHRDVKPGNVLVGRGPRVEGLVKITDFGIAHASGDVTLTQTGQITGTPAFLAPEVARGADMTPASDVFTLGATLYTCLEGEPPFGMDDNALRLLYRVAAGDFRPPRRAGSLERPLMRMLDADPARRPSMPEVRDELARLAAGRDGDPTTVLLARTALGPAPERTRTAATPVPDPGPPTPVVPSPAVVDPPTPASPTSPPTLVGQARQEPATPGPAAQGPAGQGPAGQGPAAQEATPPPGQRPTPLVGPRRRQRRPLVLALVALLVLAAVGLGTWLAVRGGGDDPSAGAATSSSADAEPPDGEPSDGSAGAPAGDTGEPADGTSGGAAPSTGTAEPTTPQPSTPQSTTESSPAPAADPATEARETLEQYYTLLPGDTAGAYELTGPTLQSRASYGYYEDFFGRWSDINLLDVRDVVERGDTITATTDVEFLAPGDRLVETHAVTFVRGGDGRLLIDLDVVA